VAVACEYPWCSVAWFERMASAAMVKSIYRFKPDRISMADEFEVSADW
jgi:putative transposase